MCHKQGLNRFKAKDFHCSYQNLNQGNTQVRWGSSFLEDKPLPSSLPCCFQTSVQQIFFHSRSSEQIPSPKGTENCSGFLGKAELPANFTFPNLMSVETCYKKETQNPIHWQGDGDMSQHAVRHRKWQIRLWQHENGRTHQTKRPSTKPVSCLCERPIAKEKLKNGASAYWECFPSCQAEERLNSGKQSSDFRTTAFALCYCSSQAHPQEDPLSGGSACSGTGRGKAGAHVQSVLPSLEASISAQLLGNF